MMYHRIHTITLLIGLACCLVLGTSCSETKNLAEDEVLYTGISRINYGYRSSHRTHSPAEGGVILAMGEAYSAVENAISGKAPIVTTTADDKTMGRILRDSLKAMPVKDQKAYSLAREEVEAVLAHEPNNSLLGSSYHRWPIPLGLWAYNKYVYSKKRFGKWMFNRFAATPIYISSVNPQVRTQVAQNTLRNYGYFRSTVTYDLVPEKSPIKSKIAYTVLPGELFHLDSIAYMQFPPQADSIVRATMRQSKLRQGAPFSVLNLDAERNRLSQQFRNNGYYYFRPEYITYRADTLQKPEHVQLQVRMLDDLPATANHQYYIGNTKLYLYKHNDLVITDSLVAGTRRSGSTYVPRDTSQVRRRNRGRSTSVYWSGGNKSPIKPFTVRRHLYYAKGDLYNQETMDAVHEKISGMGVFSQMSLRCVPRDTTSSCDTLDVEIMAMLDKPYDAEFEGKLSGKTNGQIGPGLSFSMTRHNAFRGGEDVSLHAWGSYEWQTGANIQGNRSLMNSYEYGVSLNLDYPRLKMAGLLDKLNRRALYSNTKFKVDATWLNRANYFGRVSIGGEVSYSLQKRQNIRHEYTLFRLDYEHQLSSTARFDSIMAANQALYVSMRDQFVPSMEYTLYWSSKPHHRNPSTLTLNVKEAGNVTSLLYASFAQPFTKQDKHLFGTPFAQFLKVSAEFTHRFTLSKRSCIATRLYGGAVLSYGNSRIAPYSDLFAVGGANSIRAFAVRSIGPGRYHPGTSAYSYIDEMGDIKLEANVEYRFPIVGNLYGAVFVDAGNVWLRRPDESHPGGTIKLRNLGRDIALGTGAGLRYDLDFLIVRFDLGVGVHAPYDTGRSGYYNMTRFGKSLGYHLAIGYPF